MRRDRIVFGRTAFDEVFVDQLDSSGGESKIKVSGSSKLLHITEAGHDAALLIVEFHAGGIMGGWYAITDASVKGVVIKRNVGVEVEFAGGDIRFIEKEEFEKWSEKFSDEEFEVKVCRLIAPVSKFTYEGVKA